MEETISQSFSHSRAPSDCMASASHFVRTRPNHAVRTQQTRPEISEINWRLLTILLHLPRSLAVHHGVDSIASRAAAFAVLALIMRVVIGSIAMSPGRAEACMRYGNTCATFLITGQQDVNKPVPGPGARWGASSPPPPSSFSLFLLLHLLILFLLLFFLLLLLLLTHSPTPFSRPLPFPSLL